MKRKRSTSIVGSVELPVLGSDLWTVIGSCIPCHEFGTLLSFIGICRVSIQFVLPSLERIVYTLVDGDNYAAYDATVLALKKRVVSGAYPNYRVEALLKHAHLFLTAIESGSDNLRGFISELLSLLHLCQLYYMQYEACDVVIKHPTPSSLLDNVYCCDIYSSKLTHLYRDPRVRVIADAPASPEEFIEKARKHARGRKEGAKRELALHALQTAKKNYRYAVAYHVMASHLKLKQATRHDQFKNVVITTPENKKSHIYSEYASIVCSIYNECILYTGKEINKYERALRLKLSFYDIYLKRCESRFENMMLEGLSILQPVLENSSYGDDSSDSLGGTVENSSDDDSSSSDSGLDDYRRRGPLLVKFRAK
jgi:hypothetical protein